MNNLRFLPLLNVITNSSLCKYRASNVRSLATASRDGISSSSTASTTNDGSTPNYVEVIDFDESTEVPIPKYTHKANETMELRKSRLLYQSRKRGMLENGLLLSTFAAKYLKDFNQHQMELYDNLINQPTNDWEIYYWATRNKPTPAEYDNEIMDLLKLHVSNPDRESRIRQPDL